LNCLRNPKLPINSYQLQQYFFPLPDHEEVKEVGQRFGIVRTTASLENKTVGQDVIWPYAQPIFVPRGAPGAWATPPMTSMTFERSFTIA
jgi:hypothetical protein